MPQGQFKPGTWTAVMNEFNKCANKNYSKTQLTQKYQRMKQRHPISNTVTASEEAWAAAFAVSPLTYSKQNLVQLPICIVYSCKLK